MVYTMDPETSNQRNLGKGEQKHNSNTQKLTIEKEETNLLNEFIDYTEQITTLKVFNMESIC